MVNTSTLKSTGDGRPILFLANEFKIKLFFIFCVCFFFQCFSFFFDERVVIVRNEVACLQSWLLFFSYPLGIFFRLRHFLLIIVACFFFRVKNSRETNRSRFYSTSSLSLSSVSLSPTQSHPQMKRARTCGR